MMMMMMVLMPMTPEHIGSCSLEGTFRRSFRENDCSNLWLQLFFGFIHMHAEVGDTSSHSWRYGFHHCVFWCFYLMILSSLRRTPYIPPLVRKHICRRSHKNMEVVARVRDGCVFVFFPCSIDFVNGLTKISCFTSLSWHVPWLSLRECSYRGITMSPLLGFTACSWNFIPT